MPSKVCHPLGRVVLVVLEANQLGATNSSPRKETPQNGRTVWWQKVVYNRRWQWSSTLKMNTSKKKSETIEIQLLLRVWNLAGCQVPHLLWLSVQPYQPGAKKPMTDQNWRSDVISHLDVTRTAWWTWLLCWRQQVGLTNRDVWQKQEEENVLFGTQCSMFQSKYFWQIVDSSEAYIR